MTSDPAGNARDAAEPAGTAAAEMVARADAFRPRLLEEQAATEERTRYSEELHEAFRDAGFYRLLQPRRYGGLELDVPTFYRVMTSIARGCPSTGWMLCLGSGHALQIGSYFSETAQEEIFGDGHFVSPLSFAFQDALAEPVNGDYRVRGTWHFCSGAPYSTHHAGLVPTPGGDVVVVVVPRDRYTVLDNWGDLIGLKGSGSHSIVVDEAVIPARHVLPLPQLLATDADSTPGYRLHGNPLYGGAFMAFAMGELNSVQVGNAQAAVDEYERLITARKTVVPGGGEGRRRADDANYQRSLGLALAGTDSACSILERCGDLYHRYAREAMEAGTPFSEERTFRIYGQLMTAHRLCWEAGDTVFRAASTTGARDGARMQRYWRDLCAFRTNGIHQLDFRATSIAQARLGLPVDFFDQT
jgi:3-hydroxy-9,10-secoandrosta-1,3,5(10)-triene-9,17-dione monooxygenase